MASDYWNHNVAFHRRIVRDAARQASLQGLYPCGEGAGYGGGIMSAAVDGILTAEEILKED